MKTFITNIFKGIAFGVANIIPGVSGGTIAVILKFFDRLIEAINTLFKNFKNNMIFLIPIVIGAAMGIVGFSKVLEPALNYYPFQTSMFFVGLIAGSIPIIWGLANKNKFNRSYLIPLFLALAVIVVFAIIQRPIDMEEIKEIQAQASSSADGAISGLSAPSGVFDYLYLFMAGAIASAAMVIPGISGSFVMVLLGTYNRVLASVSGLTSIFTSSSSDTLVSAVLTLIPVGLGIIVGIFGIAKIIEFLMRKFYSYTYYAILGLVGGSIFTILYTPKTYHIGNTGEPITFGFVEILLTVLTFAFGFGLAYFLGKDKSEKSEQ